MEIELLSNMDFVQMIKKPFSDIKVMSIGFVIFLISFGVSYLSSLFLNMALVLITTLISLFIGILLWGYGSKIMNEEINGEKELPSWKDIPDMFISGVKYTLISIAYLLPAFVITGVLLFSLLVVILREAYDMVPVEGTGITLLSSVNVSMVVISLAVILMSLYFLTGALANFSKSQDLMEGFNFKEIWSKVSTKNYFLSMVSLLVLVGIIQTVSFVLSFLFGGLFTLSLLIFVFFSWINIVVYHTGIGRAYGS